jgi:hypothetical protein
MFHQLGVLVRMVYIMSGAGVMRISERHSEVSFYYNEMYLISTLERGEKSVQGFSGKAGRKVTTQKTET